MANSIEKKKTNCVITTKLFFKMLGHFLHHPSLTYHSNKTNGLNIYRLISSSMGTKPAFSNQHLENKRSFWSKLISRKLPYVAWFNISCVSHPSIHSFNNLRKYISIINLSAERLNSKRIIWQYFQFKLHVTEREDKSKQKPINKMINFIRNCHHIVQIKVRTGNCN